MTFKGLIPRPLLPTARRVYGLFRPRPNRVAPAASKKPEVLSQQVLHAFWRNPDPTNRPEAYSVPVARSEFLVGLLARHGSNDGRVLEIGPNIGRNLEALRRAGYRQLEGIEISENAVSAMRETYPLLAAAATIHNAAVEEVIRTLPDSSFDVVFTMAVLEHLHPDSEWVFAEMARICRGVIVTIEDEVGRSPRHVPRHYKSIFESLGLEQIEELDPSGVGELGPTFRARVFSRARTA
jgi:SAM-dependent methyltransferase